MNFKNIITTVVIMTATFALANLVPAGFKLIVVFAGGLIVGPIAWTKRKE